MKKLTLLFAVAMLLTSFALQAQKPFAGTITTTINAEGTTDGNITSQFPIIQKSIVLGNKVKTDLNFQGIGQSVIIDGDNNIRTVVVDLSIAGMGIYYFTDTIEVSKTLKYDYVYDKGDTKTVAGYTCYKALVTVTNLEDDDTETYTLYVTEDLIPNYKDPQMPGLVGYTMYSIQEIANDGEPYNMISEVTEVKPSKKIKPVSFLLPDKAIPIEDAPVQVRQMFGLE